MEAQAFHAYEFEGKDYDCGSKEGYFEAVLAHALDDAEFGAVARELVNAAQSYMSSWQYLLTFNKSAAGLDRTD
jgi:UTP-glucose-1-phosphate uridylyltransferase